MKVLHLIAGELTGGAAKGAYCLHKGLLGSGVDSKILTNSRTTFGDKTVLSVNKSKKDYIKNIFRIQIDILPVIFYKNRERRIFNTGFFGFDFTKTKEYKEADIIHLHWINNGFVNIKHLRKVKKPIVWTIRDMWPMTGGCHYPLDCFNFKKGCGFCKQLKSKNKNDLSRLVLKRKEKYLLKKIKIVGISEWLSGQARKSKLFKDFDVRTISNNINTSEFFPVNKKIARSVLGLKTNKKIILVGASNLADFYKGFDKFLKALNELNSEDYFLCFFGKIEKKIADKIKFEYRDFGYLADVISLRLVYSAADVFVAPSIQEAFGKTLAESMACRTPVVCFDATGPKDIVDHKLNGYKAKSFEALDLARGIEWILKNKKYENICQNAVEKIKKEFDYVTIARKYKNLYKKLFTNYNK